GRVPKLLMLSFVVMFAVPDFVSAKTFKVQFSATNDDEPDRSPGDGNCEDFRGVCTLRAAIEESNALPGRDQIDIPAGHYLLTLGQLLISDSVDLIGQDPSNTIVDGNDSSRVFVISSAATVSIKDLTIRNGRATDIGQAGGGIRIEEMGSLTLSN